MSDSCDPMDCSLPRSSIHGIFQARVLEWGAIAFSIGSSQPRDRTWVSHIVDRYFTIWATREVWVHYLSDFSKTVYLSHLQGLLKHRGLIVTSGISDSVGVTGRHHNSLPSWYSCSCVPWSVNWPYWLASKEWNMGKEMEYHFCNAVLKNAVDSITLSCSLLHLSSWWKTLLCHEAVLGWSPYGKCV